MTGATARAALAVFVAAVAVYANAIPNAFVVDDIHQVVENDWIMGVRHVPEIFSRGVWEFEGRSASYYRPLMYVFYMAAWSLVGLAPWGYHLLNVLLHAAASVLVFAVAHRVLPGGAAPARSPWLAAPFVAGLVFAVHPIHTESVAWVAGIADVGMTVFGLLALWLYLVADGRERVVMPLAALSFLAATLFKEPGIVLPLVMLAYEATVRRDRWNTGRVALRLAPFAIAGAVYVGLRVHALGGFALTSAAPLTPGRHVLALLALFAGYVEKLLVPVNQNFWHVFVPPESFGSPAAWTALAVVAAALTAAWIAARRSAVVSFGVMLVLLPLLPAFHIGALNQGLENAFAERYLYFPSVGAALLAGLAARHVTRLTAPRIAVPVLLVSLVITAGAVATVRRNTTWKNGLTLWTDAVGKSPGSAIARMNYGAALLYAGRSEEGVRELRMAAGIQPALVDRQIALGAAYAGKGRVKQAILAFHTALALDPRSAAAHYALGLIYEQRGAVDRAIREYEAALALEPSYAEAHNNLGVLYAEQGRVDRALPHFDAAARLRPGDPDYRANLARARGRPRP